MAQMSQGYREPSTSGAVAATVGCSVLGMVVAGPLGAMVGAGLAVAATQPNATMFPLLQRGRHTIANVSLPRDGMTKQQGVTYFAVDVVDTNGFTWRLLRRYSHFSRFQALMNNYEIRCVFPGKTFFSCSGNELEQRRLGLEAWTRDMLRVFSSTGIPNRLQAEFEDFFTRGRSEARPPAPPLPPAAPAPAPPAPPALGQAFAVEVPGGHMAKLLSLLLPALLYQVRGTALRAADANEVSEPGQGAVVAHLLSVVDDYLTYYAEEKSSWSESKKRMTEIINHATSEESRMASINEKARMKKEHDKTVAEYVSVVKKLDKALTEMEGADWAAKHGVQEKLQSMYKESPIVLLSKSLPGGEPLASAASLKLRQFRQSFAARLPAGPTK